MKLIKIINIASVVILLLSCNKTKYIEGDDYFIDFRPRECNFVFVQPGQIVRHTWEGVEYTEYKRDAAESYTDVKELFLEIETHNLDIRDLYLNHEDAWLTIIESLDSPVIELETQIESDYHRYIQRSASILKNAKDYTAMIEMEYRLDGVTDFNVYAVDTPLFGLEAGSSLNDYFRIVRYFPDFIASSQSHQLIYGFADRDKPAAIDEWLSLSPLAQPLMYLVFKETPNDLPETIRFVVEMTTDKGTLLRDTTQVITFNR